VSFKWKPVVSKVLVTMKAYRSIETMSVQSDATFQSSSMFGDDLTCVDPFVARTVLGPKHRTWNIRGIYIPSLEPSDKIMLCMHGHGKSCTSLVWYAFFPLLQRHGFNIIAFDAPCFGRSDGNRSCQANLWRSDDDKLIVRLLQCFRCGPGMAYAMAQCMGAAMLMRALCAAPELFADKFIFHNATIGTWPTSLDAVLDKKGARLYAWHEADADHMREAVGYRHLTRLANEGVATYIDNALERAEGNSDVVLEAALVRDLQLGREADDSLFVFSPSSAVLQDVLRFLALPSRPPRHEAHAWTAPVLTSLVSGLVPSIMVCVRVRPFLPSDRVASCLGQVFSFSRSPVSDQLTRISCMTEDHPADGKREGTKGLSGGGKSPVEFDFEICCGGAASSAEALAPAIAAVTAFCRGEGGAAVFAYGQTGSGKTHTMGELMGVVAELLFEEGEVRGSFNSTWRMQMWQIYNDSCYDILDKNRLLSSRCSEPIACEVKSAGQLLQLYRQGCESRHTSFTAMNETSSRSHCLVKVTGSPGAGALLLVDLAGSERIKRSLSAGKSFSEATHINSSLLSLARVLRAKISHPPGTRGHHHIPYRDCALTQALQDVFTRPSRSSWKVQKQYRVVMYACVSPCVKDLRESLQTLQFACNTTYVNATKKTVSSNGRRGGLGGARSEGWRGTEIDHVGFHQASFGSAVIGQYVVPAGDGLPALHCIGRDYSGSATAESTTPTLVLLHYYGAEEGAAMWTDVIAQSSASCCGCGVIALSFSGHGRSGGKPPCSRPEPEVFLQDGGGVQQVLRVIKHFGVASAVVVGFDWGGGVAMQLALSYTKLVQGLVAWNPSYRLSLLDGGVHSKWPHRQQQRVFAVTKSVWMPKNKIKFLEKFLAVKSVFYQDINDVFRVAERTIAMTKPAGAL
jgi:pimeloyl-ACP methyl ester carboxylesterase